MPLRRLFAVSSVLFLAVLAISPVKNALRPYRAVQRNFRNFGVAHAATVKAARVYAERPTAVQQVWLPDFENRVDRCTTCHLGVADEAMHDAPQPFREHPATYHTPREFNRIGCTICHGGQGLATSEADAHEGGSASPILPATYVESGCGRCHSGEVVPEAVKLSHGRAMMEKAGCYACHAVRGHESFRSEAPPLDSIAAKTGAELLRRWLANPKAVDANATMPNFRLSADEIRDLSNYLFAREVPPALRTAVDQAANEPAGDAARGKTLFAEARCISCHTVDGKGNGSAPELNTVASRATRGWLIAYVRDPHAFNPRTRMPQFSFTDQDVRDIVAYFESELKDFDAPATILDPMRVNQTIAASGAKVFRNRGCFACHDPQKGERFGPDLDGIGDRKAASLDF
ncbi:MAG TPA: c-type cytochrome, partial [Thermoanaerobaculia bacterium]|nr:c-type cytochrome [Thermoanaerobaculia bacterium]